MEMVPLSPPATHISLPVPITLFSADLEVLVLKEGIFSPEHDKDSIELDFRLLPGYTGLTSL